MYKFRRFLILIHLVVISYLGSLISLNKVFAGDHSEGSPCRMDNGSMGTVQWSGERLICAMTEVGRHLFNNGPSDRELLENEREYNRDLERRIQRLEKCAKLAQYGSYPKDCPYYPNP